MSHWVKRLIKIPDTLCLIQCSKMIFLYINLNKKKQREFPVESRKFVGFFFLRFDNFERFR